jgi:hypothetical protein
MCVYRCAWVLFPQTGSRVYICACVQAHVCLCACVFENYWAHVQSSKAHLPPGLPRAPRSDHAARPGRTWHVSQRRGCVLAPWANTQACSKARPALPVPKVLSLVTIQSMGQLPLPDSKPSAAPTMGRAPQFRVPSPQVPRPQPLLV